MGDGEEVGSDGLSPDALRLAAAADGSGDKFVVCGNAGEGVGLIANVCVDGIRETVAALVPVVRGVEGEQRGGIAHGRGPQDEAADHGKDGGVGADAEADGEDGHGGCAAMLARGCAGRIRDRARSDSSQGRVRRSRWACRVCSAPPRRMRAWRRASSRVKAGADAVVGVQGDVALEFGGEVGVRGARAEKSAKTDRASALQLGAWTAP